MNAYFGTHLGTQPTALPQCNIPLSEPWLTQAEQLAVTATLAQGWLSTAAPMVDEFEQAFVSKFGFTAGVSTNCGTSALWMALVANGIGYNDEVIVPALSFAATVNPVCYVGATPVFADVDFETFGLNASGVEPHITPKTKAIIATHLYGFACDVVGLKELAQRRGLLLIEDAAEALGTTLNQQLVGGFGQFGAFSFNGNKTLTTGAGGLLVGENSVQIAEIKRLATQAKYLSAGELDHFAVGYNTRMPAISATLGLVQLQRFDELLQRRRQVAATYAEALGSAFRGCPSAGATSGWVQEPSYWLSTVRLPNPEKRLPLLKTLANLGIEARPIFKPLPLTPAFATYCGKLNAQLAYPNACKLWWEHVNLPSSGTLTLDQQFRVIEALQHEW